MRKELEKKVNFAIKLLQSIPTDEGPVEVSYSSGKDSDVILELAKMAGIPYRAIYKNTTIDRPGTIAHCKEIGAEIIQPKKTFFQLIQENGLPQTKYRFCCSKLKEYKVLDRAIVGIRRSESRNRAERYKEPEICKVYSKKEKVRIYLPILDWTDEDVEEFIKERNIKCHPHYYTAGGVFDVKRRLGCLGCPLQSKNNRIRQFREYPKMLYLYIKNAQVWYDKHKGDGKERKFTNAIDAISYQLFYNSYNDFLEDTYSMFGKRNWKEELEKYFNIDLSDIYYENNNNI